MKARALACVKRCKELGAVLRRRDVVQQVRVAAAVEANQLKDSILRDRATEQRGGRRVREGHGQDGGVRRRMQLGRVVDEVECVQSACVVRYEAVASGAVAEPDARKLCRCQVGGPPVLRFQHTSGFGQVRGDGRRDAGVAPRVRRPARAVFVV